MKKMTQKFHEPYSPTILETTVSDRFVNIVNTVADDVLSDEKKSKQWDFSHKLVGKVNKEIQIPVKGKSDREYLFSTMKQGCLDYLNYMIDKNRAQSYNRIVGEGIKPTIENIHLTQSWVVSQYAGDFNPIHHHNGDFSAAI